MKVADFVRGSYVFVPVPIIMPSGVDERQSVADGVRVNADAEKEAELHALVENVRVPEDDTDWHLDVVSESVGEALLDGERVLDGVTVLEPLTSGFDAVDDTQTV